MKNLILCFLMIFLLSCEERQDTVIVVDTVIKDSRGCRCRVSGFANVLLWVNCPLNSNQGDTLIISIK